MKIAQIKALGATDGWVDFAGQITKVGELKSRTKSSMSQNAGQAYNVQKIMVADDTDNIGVWAYATQQFLPNQQITGRGMLKEYNNVRYIDYAEVKGTGQSPAPQTTQQGPSQAAEKPKEVEKVSQDVWDKKDERMASMNALNRAVDLWIADKKPFGECSLFESADMMVGYIYKAKGRPNPDYCGEGGTREQLQEDDIPF